MKVGSLEIELLANMARLQKDMQDAQRTVGGAMQQIERAVQTAKLALEGLGVALSAAAFVGFVSRAIEAADQMGKLAQRTGVSVEALSQLQFAAKLSNVSTDDLTTGLKKLNVAIDNGVAGGKLQTTAFRNLGVSLKDAGGQVKSADQVLMGIADAFAHATDGATKTAYAVALFGKAGDQMIPLLNGGSKAIQELMDKADRLGLTISREFQQRANEFNDNLLILKASGDKLAITMGDTLVKALGEVAHAMADAAVEGGKLHALKVGLDELGNAFLGWSGNAQRKNIGWLRDDIAQLNAQLKAPVADLFGQMDDMRAKLQQKTADLDKALNAYFNLTSKAGAGRGVVNPQLLGQVGSIAQQTAKELKALGVETNAAETAYESLMKRIKERIDSADQELAKGRQLTESEKFEIKALADLETTKKRMSPAEQQAIRDKVAEATARANNVAEMQAENHNNANYAREWMKEEQEKTDAIVKQAAERDTLNQKLLDEKTGLENNLQTMDLQRQMMGATDRERNIALALLAIEQQRKAEILKIDTDIWLVDKQAARDKVNANASEASRQVQIKEDLQDQITLTQQLADLGKTLWDDLWSGGHNVLQKLGADIKKFLIDELYQLVVKQWVFNIAANVTSGAATGAAQGGISALSGGAGIAGSGFAGSMGLFGTAASTAFQGVYMGTGGLAGVGFGGTVSAGIDAIMSGELAAGLGTLAGALGPIGAGAYVLYKLLDSKHGGPKVEGGSGTAGIASFGDTSTAQKMAAAISQQYAGYASLFGLKPIDFGLQYGKDPQGTAMSQLNIAGGSYNRASLYGGQYENVQRGDANFDAEVAHSEAQAFVDNLSRQLTGPLGDLLKGINITTASTEEMNAALKVVRDVGAFDLAMKAMGATFASLTSLSIDSKQALIDKFGGVDKLAAGLGTVYDKFFTEEEKRAALQQQLTDAFQAAGVAMPATIEAYKQAWLAAKDNLGTEAGRQVFATLTQNAGTFYAAAQQVSSALGQADTAMQSLQGESTRLLIELMRAEGDAGAGGAQRLLDIQGMTDAEVAVYDLNQTYRQQIADANAAAQAVKDKAAQDAQIANQRAGLETQILQLEGNTAKLRERELAALDASLQPLQQRIYDLQDEAAAAAATAAATAQAQQAATTLVDTTRQNLVSAYQREAAALQNTAQHMTDFAKSVETFRKSLLMNDALTTLTPQQRYQEAREQFASIAAAAKGGDQDAQAKVQEAATAFLTASRTMYGSTDYYTGDFNSVQAALQMVSQQATAQATDAQRQLAVVQAQLDKLGDISTATQSIAEALSAYTAAILAAIRAGVHPNNPLGITLPGHAAGGWHGGGWSWVGENGPELRYMAPSQIYSADASRSMSFAANDEVVSALDRIGARIERLEQVSAQGHAINASATRQSAKMIGDSVSKGGWKGDLGRKAKIA